nr:unnamed protein product [Callosobruchus analis]
MLTALSEEAVYKRYCKTQILRDGPWNPMSKTQSQRTIIYLDSPVYQQVVQNPLIMLTADAGEMSALAHALRLRLLPRQPDALYRGNTELPQHHPPELAHAHHALDRLGAIRHANAEGGARLGRGGAHDHLQEGWINNSEDVIERC